MNILRSFTETVVTTPTDLFPISFEYDEKYDAVHVFLNDVAVEDLGYTVSQVNAVTLKIEPAIPEGTVRIERETDIDKMKYIFDAGALFIDQNVDADFKQIVHSQQEVRDGFIKLRGDVLPLVHGLQEALKQAQDASQAAQEAAKAAEDAATLTRLAEKIDDENGLNQQQINRGLDSVSDLVNIPTPKAGSRVYVKAYTAGTGVGGGYFIYDPTKANINNGGTVFNGWVRDSSELYFEHFGVIGNDPSVDDSVGLQRAWDYLFDKTNAVIRSEYKGDRTYYLKNSTQLNGTLAYVPNQNKLVVDLSGVKLVPTSNGITLLALNRNHTTVMRPHFQNGVGVAGCIGLIFGSNNPNVIGGSCFNLVETPVFENLKCGYKAQPTASNGASASGAYYNTVNNPIVMNCEDGAWFAGNDAALNNQNTRYNIINPRQIGGNYMFRLECVETLKVFGGSAEFVGNTTGNGAVIYQTNKYPNNTFENTNNMFFGLVAEECNRLYDNDSYSLGLIGVQNINPKKPNISGPNGRVIYNSVGKVQATSSVAKDEPAFNLTSSVFNKQMEMRITNAGDLQLWGDSVINIPQDIQMFGSTLSAGNIQAPKVSSPDTDLVLTSHGANLGLSINTDLSNTVVLWNGLGTDTVFGGAGSVRPFADNTTNLGSSVSRWSNIYAANGTIVTSDERYKQQFRSVSDSERLAAQEIRKSICMFKMNDAVELRGDGARWHTGVKAQEVVSILTKYGLDWKSYGFVCHDSWEAIPDHYITIEPAVYNKEDGSLVSKARLQFIKGITAGDRYAIRYDELAMFLLSTL